MREQGNAIMYKDTIAFLVTPHLIVTFYVNKYHVQVSSGNIV